MGMKSEYEVTHVSSLEHLRSCKDEIIELEQGIREATLFTSYRWIETWIETYHSDQELVILLVRKNNELVAFLPLIVMTVTNFKMSAKSLEFISLSSHGDIIHFPYKGNFLEITESIMSFLSKSSFRWDYFYLANLYEGDPSIVFLKYTSKGLFFYFK